MPHRLRCLPVIQEWDHAGMERRGFLLASLAGLLGTAMAAPAEAAAADLLQEVQYGPPPGYYGPPRRRRRRRCWIERVRVPRRDRFGRVFYVIRERQVCR
jgi:hypothetical protein